MWEAIKKELAQGKFLTLRGAVRELCVAPYHRTGMQRQMEQDEKRFGQAAWATAAPRLDRLKLMLARETLQLLRAKELCLNHRRAEIQGKVSQDAGDRVSETDWL